MPNKSPLTIENFEIDKLRAKAFESKKSAWGKAWNSWGDHGFPMLPLLFHAMHGKHGNIFQVTPAEHGLAWNSWDRTFL